MNQHLISKEYAGKNHILNPQRHYVKSEHTDIRQTFERIRAEQEAYSYESYEQASDRMDREAE